MKKHARELEAVVRKVDMQRSAARGRCHMLSVELGPDSGAKICSFESTSEYFRNRFGLEVSKGAFKGAFQGANFLRRNLAPGARSSHRCHVVSSPLLQDVRLGLRGGRMGETMKRTKRG